MAVRIILRWALRDEVGGGGGVLDDGKSWSVAGNRSGDVKGLG